MKSRIFSVDREISRFAGTRRGLMVWLALHLLVLLPGFLIRPLVVDSSFFSILPVAAGNPAMAAAESAVSSRLNSRIRILVGSPDFAEARRCAGNLATVLQTLPDIESVDWETREDAYEDVRKLIHENRYLLIGEEDRRLLESEPQRVADEALAMVFSPLSIARLDHLDEDPFLITDRIMMAYLGAAEGLGGEFSARDGVMSTEYQGRQYIQLIVSLAGSADQAQTVESIRTAVEALDLPNGDIVLSGFPIHNADSSSRASREIGIISSICLSLLIAVLIFVLRSVRPVWVTVAMIALAAAAGFSTTLLVFGRVHLFTLVFGTSLIGITIDYALHFFVFRFRMDGSGGRVVRHILPGVGLGMLTTIVSYTALLATPIPLLRQISVFSIVGLVSSLLSVILVFPLFGQQTGGGRVRGTGIAEGLVDNIDSAGKRRRRLRSAIIFVAAAALTPGITRLELNNDVTSFYTMSDELADAEYKAAMIGGGESYSRYFIVLGDSPTNLHETENALGRELEALEEEGKIGSWIAVSRFVPTRAVQESSLSAASRLASLAAAQYTSLGYPADSADEWNAELAAMADTVVQPEDILGVEVLSSLGDLWLGAVEDRFASVVMVSGYEDAADLSSLSGSDIYWNDAARDIGRILQRNSRLSLIMVGGAYLFIFILLALVSGVMESARICFVPAAAGLMSAGLLGWIGAPFNLFSVFGLILALGIGIDYSIFMSLGKDHRGPTLLAVSLSFLSTILAFGALSFSSFAPVADFGRSVLWGIVFAFLLAPVVTGPRTRT